MGKKMTVEEPDIDEKPVLTGQEYAIRLLQVLQDFGEDYIKVDTVITVVKMLTKHPVDNAVIFATGDAFLFGAYEFDTTEDASRFLDQLSEDVAYAAFLDGEFQVFQYPYRSRVIDEWVFVRLKQS